MIPKHLPCSSEKFWSSLGDSERTLHGGQPPALEGYRNSPSSSQEAEAEAALAASVPALLLGLIICTVARYKICVPSVALGSFAFKRHSRVSQFNDHTGRQASCWLRLAAASDSAR